MGTRAWCSRENSLATNALCKYHEVFIVHRLLMESRTEGFLLQSFFCISVHILLYIFRVHNMCKISSLFLKCKFCCFFLRTDNQKEGVV